METKDLFNISEEMLRNVEETASIVAKQETTEITTSYACVCCGSGWCTMGIAND